MAIGSWRARLRVGTGWLALALALWTTPAFADQIVLKSGSTLNGQIVGVSDGQVSINTTANGGTVKLGEYLSDIQSVIMDPPAAVTAAKGAPPAQVIETLAPIVKEYAGLPSKWVIDAMGQLADAYISSNQTDLAAALYAQINQLYPNSPYQTAATAGTAQLDLEQGKIDDALALLQPIVAKADSDLAPSPDDAYFYARAFLVYGQALEKQKKFDQALEAYLTVETMFYQNAALAAQARQDVAALRQQDPGVSVD